MVRKRRKMYSRVGMSPVIGYVLLITLVIGLATFVTIWYKQSSEKQIGQTLDYFENSAECADVKYELVFGYGDCQFGIYNLGKFKIDKVQLDYSLINGELETTTKELNILPKYGEIVSDLPTSSEIVKIKVTPIIITGTKQISCSTERTHTPKEVLC